MMSRSSQHKEKLVIKSEIHREDGNEGTAARTRPFSYDEILLRRKNKKQPKELVANSVNAGNLPREVYKEEVPNRSQSGRAYQNPRLSSAVVAKNSSKDVMKVNSRYNEDDMTKDKILRKIGKDSRDRIMRSKPTMSRDDSDKTKRSVDDRHDQWTRRQDNWLNGDIGIEYERRHPRNLIERERYSDKSRGRPSKDFVRKPRNDDEERKSEGEIKRKHRNEDEISMHQNAVKKHDAGEHHDQEAPERNDPERKEMKESSWFHDDKSRSKKKRSRSREPDKDKERRSAPSPQNDVKKHDSGKLHDREAQVKRDPERKERMESSRFHDEKSKSKTKRSRSKEHDKDKGRRSTSLSPRSHRRTEHGSAYSHSSRDRFRREQTDDERNKISHNGSSGHHRRSGGNPSGLGGYSPRKRRTEAGVKTPSPPHRSPEKKTAGWDLPPPGANTNSTASVLPNAQSLSHPVTSNTHEFPSLLSVTPMSLKVIRGVFAHASVDSVQLTEATRPMRRLYVESIPASASEKSVMECLNNFLLSSGVNRVPGSQPCISCTINKEKGQALVEFLTPEDASAALYFNGRYFSGSVLKIRRPKDYSDVDTGAADKSVVTFDSSSNIIRDSPNKIFIGGIPKVISSEMLREIAAAFGPLKAFYFEVNGDLDGPCAFLEYADQSVTVKACAGLNAMRLGGQMLTVVQATPNVPSVEIIPFYGIPEHAKPLLQKPTQVLKLKNVLNLDDLSLLSEQELEEILEDVRVECARFGTVNSVNIVKRRLGDFMPGTCQAPDVTGSVDHKGTNFVQNMKTEHSGEEIDIESQETSRLDVSRDNPEENGEDNSLEGEGTTYGENAADNVTSLDNSETVAGELACENNPWSNSPEFDQQPLDENGDRIDENIMTKDTEIETEQMVEENLKPEEASTKAVCSLGMDSSEAEKDENKDKVFDLEDAFEPGSILVEYKRTEAASVAAHCLHGRLFDDKIVSVEYAEYGTYQAKFLK